MERVTIHLGEARQYRGRSLVSALLDVLLYSGVGGVAVTREGAGVRPQIELARIAPLHPLPEYPVQVEFVASAKAVQSILPRLREMAGSALIEVQPVEVATEARQTEWQRIRCEVTRCTSISIWVGEEERWERRPLHEALVASMRAHGIAGATVLRAVAGYAGVGQGKPLLVTATDTPEHVNAWLPVLASMAPGALAILGAAESLRYQRIGEAKSDEAA